MENGMITKMPLVISMFIVMLAVAIKGLLFGTVTSGVAFVIGLIFTVTINYSLIWFVVMILFTIDYLINVVTMMIGYIRFRKE